MCMVNYRLTAGALAAVLAAGSSGCTYVSDNSKSPIFQVPTLGRELTDLKGARDAGAIDPGQYEGAKQKLLARLDKSYP